MTYGEDEEGSRWGRGHDYRFFRGETGRFFSLPMIPGEYFDSQDGKTICRCYPEAPQTVAYFTDLIIALCENRTPDDPD